MPSCGEASCLKESTRKCEACLWQCKIDWKTNLFYKIFQMRTTTSRTLLIRKVSWFLLVKQKSPVAKMVQHFFVMQYTETPVFTQIPLINCQSSAWFLNPALNLNSLSLIARPVLTLISVTPRFHTDPWPPNLFHSYDIAKESFTVITSSGYRNSAVNNASSPEALSVAIRKYLRPSLNWLSTEDVQLSAMATLRRPLRPTAGHSSQRGQLSARMSESRA